jgi:hypothetical protein
VRFGWGRLATPAGHTSAGGALMGDKAKGKGKQLKKPKADPKTKKASSDK